MDEAKTGQDDGDLCRSLRARIPHPYITRQDPGGARGDSLPHASGAARDGPRPRPTDEGDPDRGGDNGGDEVGA